MRNWVRSSVAVLAMATAVSGAQAFDITDMTVEERLAFRDEIRSYLFDNPEVLMEAVEIYNQKMEVAQAASEQDLIAAYSTALFESPSDTVFGNPDGDVVLVEFSDYRCGYCKKAHPDMKALLKDDGNIKLIIKEFPILGEASVLASQFAIALRDVAGEDAYRGFHDALMESKGEVTLGSLTRLAKDFDVDTDAVKARMDSDEVNAVIAGNHQLGGILQINGTPSFVMDDRFLRGYVPYDVMRELIGDYRLNR